MEEQDYISEKASQYLRSLYERFLRDNPGAKDELLGLKPNNATNDEMLECLMKLTAAGLAIPYLSEADGDIIVSGVAIERPNEKEMKELFQENDDDKPTDRR